MKAFALIVSLLFVLTSKTIISQENVDYSNFPESTYWVNVEYKLSPSTFKDKILVVLCWDMTDPIGKSYFNKLQALSVKSQHMQLVSLVIGDENHPNSLSDLKAFIQDNSINHPFGIAATLQPFANVKRESLPKVFVYTKDAEIPAVYGLSDGFSCDEIIYDLEKKLYDREVTKDYSYWQMKPNLATQDYAMPVLSYPSFLSTNEMDKIIFRS